MDLTIAHATPNTLPFVHGPVSRLRWVFIRKGQMLTCEISINGSQSYDVCVVPHWDVSSAVVEAFDRPAAALGRHAEIAWYLSEAGWRRVCHAADDNRAAA